MPLRFRPILGEGLKQAHAELYFVGFFTFTH